MCIRCIVSQHGFMLYILQETAQQSVCAPGAGFNPPEFWLPFGLPQVIVLSRYVSSPVAWTGHPSAFVRALVVFPQPESSCFWEA